MPSSSLAERKPPDFRGERGIGTSAAHMARGRKQVRDTSNRSPAVTGEHAQQTPRHRHRYARRQAEPSSPIQTQGTALPSGPRTLRTGLAGANHVKAPPPPLYTFEHPIEFKQLAPESRIARSQCLAQASHLVFLVPALSCFRHERCDPPARVTGRPPHPLGSFDEG
jgi:hypothetical protein